MRAHFIGTALCAALLSPHTTDAAPRYADSPVEELAESVPPRYVGNDCNAIAQRVRKVSKPRSEFEAAADYEARIATFTSQAIGPKLKGSDLLAFAVDDIWVNFSYDADVQRVSLSIRDAHNTQSIRDNGNYRFVDGLAVQELKSSRTSAVGGNAFGARLMMSKVQSVVCAVTLANQEPGRLMYFSRLDFPMAPAEARALKPRVGALLIGRMKAPFLGEYRQFFKATIDYPTEISTSGDSLVMDLVDIWYFDKVTGKVVARATTKDETYHALPPPPAWMSPAREAPASSGS
jgi:hypothetical protein